MPCPINTSTCRNFGKISSGFGRLFDMLNPPHSLYITLDQLKWGGSLSKFGLRIGINIALLMFNGLIEEI